MIAGVPGELREVLTNMIFNAVDATPDGGRLSFRTRGIREHIRLEISDTGSGMTEETLQKCFEPFFTTKGEQGSGLGLAMSYGTIRRHEGTITVESHLNKGTAFTLLLPVFKKAPGSNGSRRVKARSAMLASRGRRLPAGRLRSVSSSQAC
jgi:signal transduction histidine kinase